MYNFHLPNKYIAPVHQSINNTIFLFPVNGIDMSEMKEMMIGNVTFIDKENVMKTFYIPDYDYPVSSYALVDLSHQTFQNEYPNGLNSIALKMLKETIGFLNVSVYDRDELRREIKITISNIDRHILEEGLVQYLSLKNGKTIIENTRFNSVSLTMAKEELYSINHMNKNWISLLEQDFEKRSELHKKILKSLEYIYYISNEIYASERIIKYFIVLNNIFREGDADINRKGITKMLQIIFTHVKPQEIFKCKFTTGFENLYNEIRNRIMHGNLNLDDEEGLVNLGDYYNLKIIFYELITILTEYTYIYNLNTTKELNDYLRSLIPCR